jgi:hypothetical protein
MNIFAIAQSPLECAMALDDRRVNKMTIETAQLLNDALHLNQLPLCYGVNNPGHPLSKWVGINQSNFYWTVLLLTSLNKEYRYRYQKDVNHRSYDVALEHCMRQIRFLPKGNLTEFHNSSIFKNLPIFEAYRKTMIYKWSHFEMPPIWTNAARPDWGITLTPAEIAYAHNQLHKIKWGKQLVQIPDIGLCSVKNLSEKAAIKLQSQGYTKAQSISRGFVGLYQGGKFVDACEIEYAKNRLIKEI